MILGTLLLLIDAEFTLRYMFVNVMTSNRFY
jgi:hypothetical protein